MRAVSLVFGTTLCVAACDPMAADVAGGGTWHAQYAGDAGGLFSVWGSSPNDVWAAGGQVGSSLLLHNDGSGWVEVQTGETELLSLVYGFSDDNVYAVGEHGLIIHYDGQTWRRVESGTEQTLYGIWGASADDVWIVGGDPAGAAGSSVVLRGHGGSFAVVDDIPQALLPSTLYKIYGFASRDVIAVGSGGTVLRFDGDTWRREATPTSEPIFSLWGRGRDDLYAVGGFGPGELLHFDGDAWHEVDERGFGYGLRGVFTAMDYPVIAVGADAYVVEIDPDGFEVEPKMPAMSPVPSLHGVWGDGAGTTYAVGGDLFAYPRPMTGVILRRR